MIPNSRNVEWKTKEKYAYQLPLPTIQTFFGCVHAIFTEKETENFDVQ